MQIIVCGFVIHLNNLFCKKLTIYCEFIYRIKEWQQVEHEKVDE